MLAARPSFNLDQQVWVFRLLSATERFKKPVKLVYCLPLCLMSVDWRLESFLSLLMYITWWQNIANIHLQNKFIHLNILILCSEKMRSMKSDISVGLALHVR